MKMIVFYLSVTNQFAYASSIKQALLFVKELGGLE
jgi:hypothetical protein